MLLFSLAAEQSSEVCLHRIKRSPYIPQLTFSDELPSSPCFRVRYPLAVTSTSQSQHPRDSSRQVRLSPSLSLCSDLSPRQRHSRIIPRISRQRADESVGRSVTPEVLGLSRTPRAHPCWSPLCGQGRVSYSTNARSNAWTGSVSRPRVDETIFLQD